jgi:hypothetical protein
MKILIVILSITHIALCSTVDQSDKNLLTGIAKAYVVGGVGMGVIGHQTVQKAQSGIVRAYECYKKMDTDTAYCNTPYVNKSLYDCEKMLSRGKRFEKASKMILYPIISVLETVFLPITIPQIYKESYRLNSTEFSIVIRTPCIIN